MQALAHITFHDGNVSTTGGRPAGGSKASSSWRDFAFEAVRRSLAEMEDTYVAFRRVDVVVDVNEDNAYQERLARWEREVAAKRVSLRVESHPKSRLRHPFRLAWVHREHMSARVEQYDWFLLVEADTLIPGAAIAAQVALAPQLYQRHGLLLGFVRAVNDTKGNTLCSDITKPQKRSLVTALPGLGEFVTPQTTYAAAWAYPREVMRRFVASGDWTPTLRTTRGMRERAAWGWRYGPRIVTSVGGLGAGASGGAGRALLVYHLGKSGRFYERVRGHNSLPVHKIVSDR